MSKQTTTLLTIGGSLAWLAFVAFLAWHEGVIQ